MSSRLALLIALGAMGMVALAGSAPVPSNPSRLNAQAVTVEERVAGLETRVSVLEGAPPTTATLAPIPATATSIAATVTAVGATSTAIVATSTSVAATATSVAATSTTVGATATAIVATLTAIPATSIPPSGTPIPESTPTPIPPGTTPTNPPPTPSPVVVAGQECPAWVHNNHTTIGPDGKTYPTWHPAVDASGCWFAHEHGDDPRVSKANSALPAFGYIGQLVGDQEPHNGFKVFVQPAGAVNEDGRTLYHDARLVVHMGTSGPARFTTRFHSLQFDLITRDGTGHEMHVMGMADTFAASSICEPRLAKTVMVVPGLCHTDSPYEIWSTRLRVGNSSNGYRAEINTAWGVFDPITIMDPGDPTRTLLMKDYYPQYGSNPVGGKREGYSCPCYWANGSGGGTTTFRTDAYGVERADGPIVQTVSRHTDLGVPMYRPKAGDPAQTQAKLPSHHHGNSRLRSPN